ncbi:MAG: class I adenylate-forming enzyme family protein [Gemmatimonadota bacterium]
MKRDDIPDPGYDTFPDMLRFLVERFGPRECIVLGNDRISFAEADAASARLARSLLATGVGKGTRVGLLAPNGPDFVVGMLATTRIGAILVPINTLYQAPELGWTLRHADVQTLLTVPRLLSHDYLGRLEEALPGLATAGSPDLQLTSAPYLRRIRVFGGADRAWSCSDGAAVRDDLLHAAETQVRPADTGAIIYTSGSTADPKAVVHTQGALVRHAWWLGQAHGFVPGDRVFTPNAFFFVGGFVFSLLAPMQMGSCLVCEERFDPGATLDLIERERATIVTGWPHYGPAMAAHESFPRRDLSSIRAGYLFEILPPTATRFHYSLGMTETCSPHTFWPPSESLPVGSLGVAVPGVEHKVVDPESGMTRPAGESGELCVRGYTLMQGMYGREREEVFEADGWYRTGDHVTLDVDGHLRFHGRLGDVIKTAGANVSPKEVETVLMGIPGVLEAHVVGLPDPERGQLVAAAVVPDGSVVLEADGLRSILRANLAAYKVPRQFEFFAKPDLPYKATGKIDKRALVERMRVR